MKTFPNPLLSGVLINGVLTISNFEIKKTNWKLANNGKETVTLWLDLPKCPGFALEKPVKFLEELSDCYRFEIEMKPKEFNDFAFVQKREVKNTVSLMNCEEKTIGMYASNNYFSEETKVFLQQIFELFQKRTTIKNSVKDCEQNITRNSEEQNRIRKNLEALASDQPKEAELRAKWLDSLSLTENNILGLRKKIEGLENQLPDLEEEIAKKFSDFKNPERKSE